MAESLVMARRARASAAGDAEPVIVDTEQPDVVVLRLDDGDCLEFDRRELRAALGEAA